MIRIGFIGCNNVFDRHYSAICRLDKEFKIVAISDTNPEVLGRRCKETGATGYIDFKEMIDQESPDLVIVATPHHLHTEQSLYAIRNHCHVLIEKPPVINGKDVTLLNLEAKRYGVGVSTVLQLRYNRSLLDIQTILKHPEFGDPQSFHLDICVYRDKSYYQSWYGDDRKSGGILYDVGIHYVDFLIQALEQPLDVISSDKKTYPGKRQSYTISAQTQSGIGGTIEISTTDKPERIKTKLSVESNQGKVEVGEQYLSRVTTCVPEALKPFCQSVGLASYSASDNYNTLYQNLSRNRPITLEDTRSVLHFIDLAHIMR